MKKQIVLLFVTLVVTSACALAQESQSPKIRSVIIHDFYVQLGLHTQFEQNGTLEDFRFLAPRSDLLMGDFTGYDQSSGNITSTTSIFSMKLGLDFANKDKTAYRKNPQLRLGLSYFTGSGISGGLTRTDRKPYDTLTSGQTGQAYCVDSVSTKTYYLNYTSQQIRFTASVNFRTNPQARWSLYAGIGISAGMSLHTETDISYINDKYTEVLFENGNNYTTMPWQPENKTQSFGNRNNFGFSAFIPMGIDFRLGKKNEFWKHIHLFYELGPGLNINVIPELGAITNASLQHGLGLKVSID
jgi:hypothetical protein